MQTECPHCHTIFRITEQQLEQADGQVKCGHCLAIFTANNPYQSGFDAENETSSFDDDLNLQNTRAETNDPTMEVLPDVIPPELRAETRAPKNHLGFMGGFLLSLAIILAILAGITQFAYYNRLKLVQHTELRPWIGILCKITKCEIPEPRNPDLITLSSKNIFTHPNVKQALMVNATIVNQAAYEQDFPLLELRFENIRGEVIAARRFLPKEYLGIPQQQITKMEPNNPVSFNIEILDPGKDMISYEFNFL